MNDLKEEIKKKRPNIAKSSIATYSSILKNLYIKVFGDDDLDIKKFNDTKKILEFLKTIEPNKRKTILSALVIITDNKEYRDLMLDDIKHYNEQMNKQEKDDKQNESWISTDDIRKIFDDYQNTALLLYKKTNLKPNDLQHIQNYIILCLLSGQFIPPRRSLDYCTFKIKDVDKKTDNYIDKNQMVFNNYKTKKTYGTQTVDIPPLLKKILNKWISINPTPYLLFDINMNPLSSVKLNQRLNKIFGNKISVNQMRHSYLSDKYQQTIKLNENLNNDLQQMGSSMNMYKTYVKKED